MVRTNFGGDEIDEIEMFEKIKEIMIDILRGYPAHIYWGIFEGRFEGNLGDIVRERLEEDGILKSEGFDSEKGHVYRLTPKGVGFAVSLRNLNYSEKIAKYSEELSHYEKEVLRYTRETHKLNKRTRSLTIVMVIFTILVFFVGLAQLVLTYFRTSPTFIDIFIQNPIF